MTKQDDGGPAFPGREYRTRDFSMGMTLRDWIAGQVSISGWELPIEDFARIVGCEVPKAGDTESTIALGAACEAYLRYTIADAMLAERAKKRDDNNEGSAS